jgi:betaine-aldehyde dehydrogenase
MLKALHYVGGRFLPEGDYASVDVLNPATGESIGKQSVGTAEVVRSAIVVAREAFERTQWARVPRQRSLALFRLADIVEQHRDELVSLIVLENGKLRAEAAFEVSTSIVELRYYAGLAGSIYGRSIESAPGVHSHITREPAGVAAIIVPWNAPLILLIRSLAPALAAGCTTVLKPAPQTPLTHACIVELASQVEEIPRGVINSVNEDGKIVGEALVTSPLVDVVSFTGSSATGKAIMSAAAPTLKRLSLELGGKAPAIVFPGADIGQAVTGITRSSLIIAGQMCVAISRVLVHSECYDQFENALAESYRSIRVGPGSSPESQMGSIIDLANRDRLRGLIEAAREEGELVVEGASLGGEYERGAFLTPSLFRMHDTKSSLIQQEHFGPLVSIERFADELEAVEKANATVFGLSASVWTQDISQAMRVGRSLRMGTVWINDHGKLLPEAETGGFGESGLGRLHGIEALSDFLETKHYYLSAGAQLQNTRALEGE